MAFRFTLQTVYGGKEKFFLETLDAYLSNAEDHHFPDPDSFSVDDLADWLESIASDEKIPRIEDNGCLAFNAIGQFDRGDAQVNARIERYLVSLETRFSTILSTAESRGEVSLPQSPDQSAKVLMSLLLGLHSVIKARATDAIAQTYAKAIADLLRGWKAQVSDIE